MEQLQEKCDDLATRRGNICIVGVPEQPGTSSPVAVSKLLKESLQLVKEVKIDRSHRSIAKRKPGGKPQVVIAKLHYDGDAVEILKKARERAPLSHNGNNIAIFPDYTAGISRARVVFTDVRKALQGQQGVRYGLFYPAKLQVTYNSIEKEFLNASKAMKYVKKNLPAYIDTGHTSHYIGDKWVLMMTIILQFIA